LQGLWPQRTQQCLQAVPEEECHAAPAGHAEQCRTFGEQRGEPEHPQADEDGIAEDAQRGHGQVVLAAQALRQDEGILRPDRDDQAGGHGQPVQITAPEGSHDEDLARNEGWQSGWGRRIRETNIR